MYYPKIEMKNQKSSPKVFWETQLPPKNLIKDTSHQMHILVANLNTKCCRSRLKLAPPQKRSRR